MFGNSALNKMIRDGTISKCERIIVEWGHAVSVCVLGDPAYSFLPFLMNKFLKGEKNSSERSSSAGMVIDCAFGRLKVRFGCLRKEIDINSKELPAIIHSCFTLDNFCEIRQETVNQDDVLIAPNYDVEFKPEVNNNETGDKRIRNIFVKYFE